MDGDRFESDISQCLSLSIILGFLALRMYHLFKTTEYKWSELCNSSDTGAWAGMERVAVGMKYEKHLKC